MQLLSLTGPSLIVASLAYVYRQGCADPTFPVSVPMCACFWFIVYAAGAIPRCPLFPDRFFKPNIFPLLYRVYCSELIGYRVLKPVMHAPSPYPHTDFRTGIRLLSGSRGTFSFLHVAPPTTCVAAEATARRSAAAAVQQYYNKSGESKVVNGARGSDYVNLASVASQAEKTGTLVIPVPMFTDNYAYLVVSLDTHCVVAVDPADPKAVLQFLRSAERIIGAPLLLTEVLTTHKHWDHAGGNQTLSDLARNHARTTARPTGPPSGAEVTVESLAYLVSPDLEIIGSVTDKPMACTRLVEPMDLLYVAEKRIAVRVLQAPGHTSGSVIYVVGDVPPAEPVNPAAPSTSSVAVCTALFTGDALFSGGFGAPFETVTLESVARTRQSFLVDPAVTTQPHTGETVSDERVLIYCGHEYTERILGEVEDITRKLVKEVSSVAQLKTYLRDVCMERKLVRSLRVESDGLQDVANEARSQSSTARSSYRLPASTMPTTLAIEKRINPLLTLDESAFAEPSVKPLWSADTFDQAALERLLYSSPRRSVCFAKTKAAKTSAPTTGAGSVEGIE